MLRFLTAFAIKASIPVSLGFLVMAFAGPFNLPSGPFEWFITGWSAQALFGAAVTSLREPKETSPDWYIFVYRFGHKALSRGTAYEAHPAVWKMFARIAQKAEEPAP